MAIHPTLKTKRVINFEEDSNKISENDKITLDMAKEKHAFNQVKLEIRQQKVYSKWENTEHPNGL